MRIADIQRFCTHDGPGIRTTVFLKGCPLRCSWCHNPETQNAKPELLYYENECIFCRSCSACDNSAHVFDDRHILNRDKCKACGKCVETCTTNAIELVGSELSLQEALDMILRDKAFFGEVGGVTLSGGEPFMQAEEAIALLRLCKENGIDTAVETCGCFDPVILRDAVSVTDLFLWDINDTDMTRHREYTDVSNEKIIDNLFMADSLGAKTRIRCILVNGVHTNESHYNAVADIVLQLKNCEGVELLAYHSFGGAKEIALTGKNEPHDGWVPSPEQVAFAKSVLKKRSVKVL